MAIGHADTFDSYAVTADVLANWGTVQTPWTLTAGAGRDGGNAMVVSTTGGSVLKTFGAIFNDGTICVAGWIKISAPPAAAAQLLNFRSAADVNHGGIGVTTGGVLTARDASQVVRFTGARNVCDGNWHWIEFYFNLATSKMYVDTVLEWNGTAAGWSPSGGGQISDRYEWVSIAGVTTTLSWEFAWNNTAGGGFVVADLPVGPRGMTYRPVNGDSAVSMTPSSGATNYLMVDDVGADGDATYVETATPNAQDLYDVVNLGFGPSAINAVLGKAVWENPNPGTANGRVIAKNGATQTNGSSIILPSTYRTTMQVFPTDPNTAAAWTQGGFDTAKFGAQFLG